MPDWAIAGVVGMSLIPAYIIWAEFLREPVLRRAEVAGEWLFTRPAAFRRIIVRRS